MLIVRFEPTQLLKWKWALVKVGKTAVFQAENGPYFNAVEFCNLLRINISTQKYAAGYQSYNEQYLAWKSTYGKGAGRVNYWELYGDLLANIKPSKTGKGKNKGWLGGVGAGISDDGGKSWLGTGSKGKPRYIAAYGVWGEYGRRGQAARPLFTPTSEEYEKTGFVQQSDKSLNMILNVWH